MGAPAWRKCFITPAASGTFQRDHLHLGNNQTPSSQLRSACCLSEERVRQWVSTFYKVAGLQTDEAPVSRPRLARPQRPRPGAQDPRGAGASAEQGRAQCGHQALAASQKHTWDPTWSLTAAVMTQSKATNGHTDAREGLAHEASRVWVRFSARCERNAPRAARMLRADTGSPRSLPGRPHYPRGRRKVPASCLGTTGTQQGAVCR